MREKRTVRIGVVTMIATLLIAPCLSGGVIAAPSSNDSVNIDSDGDGEFATNATVSDKEAYVDEIHRQIDAAQSDVGTSGTATKSDTAIKDVMGASLQLYTEQTGTTSAGTVWVHYSGSGQTSGSWYGADPTNADKITLGSQVQMNGVEVSLSIPPGANFGSVAGNTATYSGTFPNEWNAVHYYDQFEGKSLGLYGVQQSDSATFRFGNTDYTL